MSVYLCVPSARSIDDAAKAFEMWLRRGYKLAVWRDQSQDIHSFQEFYSIRPDVAIVGKYPGYASACNQLTEVVLEDSEAEWLVFAGDDTEPDPNHSAEEIAVQCKLHFGIPASPLFPRCVGHTKDGVAVGLDALQCMTFGVMQPTGDRFAQGSIDRICGSPWIGREFARRMYGGNGPYWPEYRHMFVDEELQEVALKMGVLWQRPDLVHLHHHYQRESTALDSRAVWKEAPAHLVEANSPEHWNKYKAIFQARKAAGFPGHEPI